MLLSRNWLSEYTDVSHISDEKYCAEMTLSGSKVETLEHPGDEIKNVVVGLVEEIERHPDSDHLWVCQVNVGKEENVQIVTGAQNVRKGDKVPVALHKSLLPGGKKIEKGKLRGMESCGMMCSLSELGLDLHDFPDAIEDGIWIITDDCKPGDDIKDIMGANDSIIDFEITPNRPDCLSIIGLARETAATFGTELKLHTPVVKGSGGNAAEMVSIKIEDPSLCRRYTARMVKNVKIAPSPKWMRQRLRASGVRPISNIVDITNYVMLEYGQPMHAFDFSCVSGGKIIVRTARPGEKITTLDGNARELTPNMLCICDETKPVCVAGVMGGLDSEIVGDTAVVLFESANFAGPSVRRTATALGMRTDSSGRFEKGLDVKNTMAAVNRACELVELLGCGEVVDGVVDVFPNPPEQTKVKLEPEKVNALLGTDISEKEMRDILLKLGFELDGDMILVPSWRGDVEHYSDIAEEVARFHGYNNIPTTLQRGAATHGGYSETQKTEKELGAICRMNGYSEILTYSFVSPSCFDKINVPADSPMRDTLKILNPLGEDTSVMRTSALPSMLEILARNYAARNENVKLYELAKIYLKKENADIGHGETVAYEPKILSLGAYGEHMDFYKIKGVAESIFDQLRIENVTYEACRENPSYHPGRCALVKCGDVELGIIGQIHPLVAEGYGLGETYAAELNVAALIECAKDERRYIPLPKYPAVTRDIAVVCDKNITIATLIDCIKRNGGELLKDVKLFDIYMGSHIPEGKKSTAFSMKLRSDDQTLTDEHADETVKKVLEGLEKELGAVIR